MSHRHRRKARISHGAMSFNLATILRETAAATPDALVYRAGDADRDLPRARRAVRPVRGRPARGWPDAWSGRRHPAAERAAVPDRVLRRAQGRDGRPAAQPAAEGAGDRAPAHRLRGQRSWSGSPGCTPRRPRPASSSACRSTWSAIQPRCPMARGRSRDLMSSAPLAEPGGEIWPGDADDTAVLIYTSGTTGKPKGAELTHFLLYMNCTISGQLFGARPDDVTLAVLPFFHVFGLSSVINVSVRYGGCLSIVPRFEPGARARRDRGAQVHGHRRRADDAARARPAGHRRPRPGRAAGRGLRRCVAARGRHAHVRGASTASRCSKATACRRPAAPPHSTGPTTASRCRSASRSGACRCASPTADDQPLPRGPRPHRRDPDPRPQRDEGLPQPAGGDRERAGGRLAAHRRPRLPSTRTASTSSSTAPRTWSSAAGTTSTRARSRRCCTRTPTSTKPRSSASQTTGSARKSSPSSCCSPGASLDAAEIIAYCRERLAAYKYPREVRFRAELPKGPTGKILKTELREG